MKSVKYLFSSHKGSIVSSLIALSVITTSAVGLFQYMRHFRTSVTHVEQAGGQPILMNTILNNMKSLLIEKQIDQDGMATTQVNGVSVPNKNIYGICSLIKPVDGERANDQLLMSFSNIKKDSKNWGIDRWNALFPTSEWEIVDGTECRDFTGKDAPSANETSGSFKRCVKKIQTENNMSTLIALAEIVPEKINTKENKANPIRLNTITEPLIDKGDTSSPRGYNPKSIIFRLKVYAMYQSAGGEASHLVGYRENIIWANDVGRCHVRTTDNEWKIVQFSGVGTGTTSEDYIINSTLTAEQRRCQNHINIGGLNQDIVQVGAFLRDYGSVGSIAAVGASCTANVFRCKNQELQRDDFDDLKLSFAINNKSGADKRVEKLKMTFVKQSVGNTFTEIDKTSNGELDNSNIQFFFSPDQTETSSDTPFQVPRNLEQGHHSFTMEIDPQNVKTVCSEICNQYNPSRPRTYYYPKLDIDFQKETKQCPSQSTWNENPNNRIRCTVCHMKSCHRRGLGTFGPYRSEEMIINNLIVEEEQTAGARYVSGLPEEPLDGQIPECKVNEYDNNKDINQIPDNIKNITIDSKSANNNCVVIKSWSDKPGDFKNHNYATANCEDSKPVLCFINGHYIPALTAPEDGQQLEQALSLKESPFAEAAKTCYELGKEVGNAFELYSHINSLYNPTGGDINALLRPLYTILALPGTTNFISPVPTLSASMTEEEIAQVLQELPEQLNQDTTYELVNNATRGLFLAPPNYNVSYNIGSNNSRQIIQTLINSVSGKEMWVGLELDAGGFAVSTPPSAMIAKGHPFAIFFNKAASVQNRITILRDTNNSPESRGSEYLALGYNIRWKGLIPTNDNRTLPFVCTNKEQNKFFLTKNEDNRGTPQEGHEKCKAENRDWIFAPPVSALDWTKMMLELNPNDPQYPFPDPGGGTSMLPSGNVSLKKAWVALHDPDKEMYNPDNRTYKHSGIANKLRLALPKDTDSLFTNDSADNIKNSIKNNSGVIKVTHSDKTLKLHTDSLLPPTIPTGVSYDSLKTQVTPPPYQVCLAQKDPHKKPLPSELKPIDEKCSISLDETNVFEPTSYIFMSHLMELVLNKNNRDDEYLLVVNPMAFKDSIEYRIKFDQFRTANGRVQELCNQLNMERRRTCTVPCSPPETGDDCQAPCNPERISQLEKDIERVKTLKDAVNGIAGKYNSPALTSIPNTQMNTCSTL